MNIASSFFLNNNKSEEWTHMWVCWEDNHSGSDQQIKCPKVFTAFFFFPSKWIRNFNCQNQESNTTRFYTWDYKKDVAHQKVQHNLHAICYSYQRLYINICENTTFQNNYESQKKLSMPFSEDSGCGRADMRTGLWIRSGC